MGIEIEKKFLVTGDTWRQLGEGKEYCQGYLSAGDGATVRVRIADGHGFLTIKGPGDGAKKQEFEYGIPLEDAIQMLKTLCRKPLIEKTRYRVPYEGFVWEVDEFKGENEGLIFAEIELNYVDQPFKKPEWIGKEVTSDGRFYNSNLVSYPYSQWKE